MDQSKKKKYMFIAGPLVIFITLIGLTYAFFNYTRTGQANTLGTGRIFFNTTQGEALTLTNVFPMTATEASNANLDSVTVGITGDTTYTDGEEFLITIVDVENTVNNKKIPMNYTATYTAATGGTIGTSSNDYWSARNSKDATIYQLNATGQVEEGKQILIGYVDNGATGISGTLTIKAYIDADRVAISDTYYENATATPTPTGPNDQYGTTTEWVNGRTILTTSEWNSLSSNPISFKIKAESNEGIWVIPVIPSCPECVYTRIPTNSNPWYTTWNTSNQTPTVVNDSDYYKNYQELVSTSGKNYFLGLKLNGGNQIEKAYACGIKGENPNQGVAFCIDSSVIPRYYPPTNTYDSNVQLLQSLWNGECTYTIALNCSGVVRAYWYTTGTGTGGVAESGSPCEVSTNGSIKCYG